MSDDKPDRPAFGSLTRRPNGPRPAPDASSDPIDRQVAPPRPLIPTVQSTESKSSADVPTPVTAVEASPRGTSTPIVVTKRGRGPARPFTTTIGDEVKALMEQVKKEQDLDLREIIETAVVEKYGHLRG